MKKYFSNKNSIYIGIFLFLLQPVSLLALTLQQKIFFSGYVAAQRCLLKQGHVSRDRFEASKKISIRKYGYDFYSDRKINRGANMFLKEMMSRGIICSNTREMNNLSNQLPNKFFQKLTNTLR